MTNYKPITASELKRELRQFTGDLERFRHRINRRVIYTPGVQHLAERTGAYCDSPVLSDSGGPDFLLRR
ncbi:MAG: hypothetical protein V3V10_06170 [Planctomycetota bacterium]